MGGIWPAEFLGRKETSTRFEHSTDEASAVWGTHHLDLDFTLRTYKLISYTAVWNWSGCPAACERKGGKGGRDCEIYDQAPGQEGQSSMGNRGASTRPFDLEEMQIGGQGTTC